MQFLALNSLIKIKTQQLELLLVLILYGLAHASHIACKSIVHCTVVECEVNVIHEPLRRGILVVLNFGFDRPEIHRVLNYVVVVFETERVSVDRGGEQPRVLRPT